MPYKFPVCFGVQNVCKLHSVGLVFLQQGPYERCKAPVECVIKLLLSLVQGVGRRYANLVCKKADIDMNKRAGELTDEEVSQC